VLQLEVVNENSSLLEAALTTSFAAVCKGPPLQIRHLTNLVSGTPSKYWVVHKFVNQSELGLSWFGTKSVLSSEVKITKSALKVRPFE
jgi:hypothetical protein